MTLPLSEAPLPEQRRSRSRAWLPDCIGILVVCVVVLIGYFEIPFDGKTFSAADQVVGVQGCGSPSGACAKHEANDPRVDPYAGSWALDPWGHVVHRGLDDGEVPLWNPYQGIGTPLAGNMQSSVFDPLLAVFHIHPTLLVQDLSFLVALLLIGLGGYAAARSMRLSPLAATVAGSVYGLSGWFFGYSNNHWFSIYVYLPFAIACIEWILRSRRRAPVVLLAVTVAATVFAGMPEPMFMSFVAIGIYSLARLWIGPRVDTRAWSAVRLAAGAAIGLALAAPLLLLFGQYLPLSVNSHNNLGDQPPLTDSPGYFLNWLMPKISPVASDSHGYSRNWVGLGAVILATAGVTSARARRRFPVWPLLAVFAVLALQIYGGSLVAWTRFIPVWSQALWPSFGTPIIACTVALLAAVGVQTLQDGEVSRRGFLVGVGVLGAIAVLLAALDSRLFAVRDEVSFAGGWPLALLVGLGLVALVLVARVPHRAIVVVAIVVVEVVLLAPRGFYAPRESAYPSRTWLDYVAMHTTDANGRVFSTDGTLFPDTAGVYGLSDLRMVDALYVDRYWVYLRNFISGGILDRFIATGATETAPNIAANPMFDILNVRYVLYDRRSGTDLPDNAKDQYELVFQGDGVKVYENRDYAPRAFVATDVHAAPDEAAALRFLRRGETVRTDGSVQLVVKDPLRTAVIEADPSDVPRRKTCNEPVTSSAHVVSYSASTVKLAVDSSCDGLVVLGDEYYPGWSATVNGDDARIFATDVALRGVFVRAGHSIVEFRYRPAAFRIGVVLAALGAVAAMLFVTVPVLVAASPLSCERASPVTQAPTLEASPPISRPPARPRSRRWLPDVIALVVVGLVVLVGYYEVPFTGKTFDASAQVAGVQGCGGNTEPPFVVCQGRTADDPRVDLGASSWALNPWSQVTHGEYADHQVPLWNPYQGLGMPLAGNMQSGVFDPLLLAVHIQPTPLVQDLSTMLALLLVGLGAYAAARSMRISPLAAVVAGSVYGLSGWFFVYSNNHWFSVFVWLPLIVAGIEWTLRSTRPLPIGLLALALAGSVLAGMPEPTFIIFVVAGIYGLLRLFVGPRTDTPRRAGALRLAVGAGIGLALTAPLLMVFREYLPLSHNIHEKLGDTAPKTDPGSLLLNWMMPKISALSFYTRKSSRNWVGVGAILLAVVGVTSAPARRRFPVWPILVIVGLVAFQIYGGGLVAWTRFIPVWSQVLWPTFGTPVIAFGVAILAAVGVQVVLDAQIDRRHLVMGLALVGAAVVLSLVTSTRTIQFTENVNLFGGWPLAIVVAAAIIGLLFMVQSQWSGVIVVALVVVEIVLLAPHGFYLPRDDPYPSYAWVSNLQDRTAVDQSRVFSADGLLYPDTAGVYQLSDPRMLDALYVERYFRYLRTFVASGLDDRFTGTGPFESAPNVAANPMFDLLGVRYVIYNKDAGGAPPSWSEGQYRAVDRDGAVIVYENTHAAPRAFVAHDVHRVGDVDAALHFFTRGQHASFPDATVQVSVDPTRTAVVEAARGDVPATSSCAADATSTARVVSRTPNFVKVVVENSCPGLLVLSDQYYPGWSATVNGRDARIYATDVALRGVFVPTGDSTVEFHYRPSSFRVGIAVWVIAVLALLGLLLWVPLTRLDDRRKQRRRARKLGEHAGVAAEGAAAVGGPGP